MMTMLPKPCPDKKAYDKKINKGLSRFPERKQNFEKYKAYKRGEPVTHMPIKMDYEVVSRCNFRCIMCLIKKIPKGQRAPDMSFANFKQSLNEQYGLIEIKLQGLGEPLLNKSLFDMISFADERDIWTRTATNGSLLLRNEYYKKLIDANIGEVQVSIDGATPDVFNEIRIGANFEKIVKGVTLLNQYANSRNLLKTRSYTVVQNKNEDQLEDILELCIRMEFRRVTFSLDVHCFTDEEMMKTLDNIKSKNVLSIKRAEKLMDVGEKCGIEVTFITPTQRYQFGKNGHLKALEKICEWPFERAFIGSDMRLCPCCTVSNPDRYYMGNYADFSKEWFKGKFNDFRDMHVKGMPPSICNLCYGTFPIKIKGWTK